MSASAGMGRPLIVLEGSAARDGPRLAERHAAEGVSIRAGFGPVPATSRPTVCHGIVASEADAEAALLAALNGHGLIVEADAAQEVIDRLVDDLRRLGDVDHRPEGHVEPSRDVASMHPDSRRLLELVGDGLTLGEAAARLGIARRTADRRLAEARRALGAERTTEAVAKARRAGLEGDPRWSVAHVRDLNR